MPKKSSSAAGAQKKQILERIHRQLETLGKSAREVSLDAGLGPDAIRDLERRPKVMPRIDTVTALASVLDMDPAELAFGARRQRRSPLPATMRVIGEVAAGLWLDLDGFEDREYEQHPIPFHPDYPEEAQYGLIVLGTSINRVAQAGDVLQCVDVGISGLSPKDGDLVIVERRRAGQKEVTAKVFHPRERVIELAPDSTDPRWTQPFVIDPRAPTHDEEIQVIAIVYAVYKPLRRR